MDTEPDKKTKRAAEREQVLQHLYDAAQQCFPASDRGYINRFAPGSWIAAGRWQYRLDICRHCGRAYYNKRIRGVMYRIHNWWHYCTKGRCAACSPRGLNKINPAPSFYFTTVAELIKPEAGFAGLRPRAGAASIFA